MSGSRYADLHRVFTEACRLEPAERAAYLDDACDGAPDLRAEVDLLLAADAEAVVPLDAAVADGGAPFLAGALAEGGEIAARQIEHPERIADYRVLRVLGEGGMGVVYEAEQDDPKRRVALKVVRSSMVTPSLLQRFRHEAQVLGQLRHPGVAQIYAAGTDDRGEGGQPYFAMELVEGEPLLDYADAHDLETDARLDLIARVCDALHHAHQKGVIHRDLKPGNILVTAESTTASSRQSPQPKILDFGVARATDADLQTVTIETTMGQLIGTVPYMSPEQASGDPAAIDIRSDVYGIGVVAYELLTGRLPYPVRGKLVHEAVRVIREDEPSSLSSIDRGLRGDVETIITKALEKDTARRYQSAAELAADIRRHLEHEPIAARPASAIYQLRKFTRRNKPHVVAAVTTLFVAIAGAVIATAFAISATRHAAVADRTSYIVGVAAATGAIERRDVVAARHHLELLPVRAPRLGVRLPVRPAHPPRRRVAIPRAGGLLLECEVAGLRSDRAVHVRRAEQRLDRRLGCHDRRVRQDDCGREHGQRTRV